MISVLLITSFSIPVSAKSNSENDSYLSEEFWNTAEITEQDGVVVLSKTTPVEGQINGNARSVNVGQEENVETYMNQTILLLPKEGYTTEDIYEEMNDRYNSTYALGSGSLTETARDSSISIEATLTIYYQRYIFRRKSIR